MSGNLPTITREGNRMVAEGGLAVAVADSVSGVVAATHMNPKIQLLEAIPLKLIVLRLFLTAGIVRLRDCRLR